MMSEINYVISRFGKTVRGQREQRRWSQEQLADEAGLNRSYVGEIERGASTASLLTIIKLAQAFGVAPGELLDPSVVSEQILS